jgi:putative ABC transport system ATP-binding protein
MQEVFSLRDVIYRDIIILPELIIPDCSLFAITGKSGGGKSTLLKLLNNLISCDQGEIFYYGNNIKSIDPVILRRKIIMVPQSPFIFPGNLEENIRLAFYFNRKEMPGQALIQDLLNTFGLFTDLKQETHNLSGGEKQRLALVRALLLEPETILLDEPTAALDSENAKVVLDYLSDWVENERKTVVMVTHAGELVVNRASQLLTLKDGQVEQIKQHAGTGRGTNA